MSETATIRVDRRVRDVLAHTAEENGLTLAELLRRYAREEMIASERRARIASYQSPEAMAEQDLWDTTVGDGLD